MKIIFPAIFFVVFLCFSSRSIAGNPTSFQARVTYYAADKKWGNRVAWSKVKVAKRGRTVAASSRWSFGTKFHIPALKGVVGTGYFVKEDVGPAVEKRIASRGKLPVIDVYVGTRAEVNRLKKTMPTIMKVYVK